MGWCGNTCAQALLLGLTLLWPNTGPDSWIQTSVQLLLLFVYECGRLSNARKQTLGLPGARCIEELLAKMRTAHAMHSSGGLVFGCAKNRPTVLNTTVLNTTMILLSWEPQCFQDQATPLHSFLGLCVCCVIQSLHGTDDAAMLPDAEARSADASKDMMGTHVQGW